MLDVAVFIMDHIKTLDILFVSNQVKANLARSIVNFTKTQCSEKHLLVYVESITLMLLDVMADENFQHDKLIELHASIMATGASVATPLASGEEQTKGAFRGCRNLSAVLIPSSVTVIDKNAFDRSTQLKTVKLRGGLYNY